MFSNSIRQKPFLLKKKTIITTKKTSFDNKIIFNFITVRYLTA